MINLIKEYRLKNGLTQEQLAEKLSISTRQLQRIEKDERRTTIEMLKKIRIILQIPDYDMIKVFYSKEELSKDKVHN